MSFFKQLVSKKYWFIPTKNDSIRYRKDELKRINEEYQEVFNKMMLKGAIQSRLLNKLTGTFNEEQQKLWLENKCISEEIVFNKQRLNFFDERIKEIPEEINKLNN